MSFFDSIGGAVGDLFAAKGYKIQAAGYRKAASIEGQNADLSNEATSIREMQISRQIYGVLGGQQADIAAAGFSETGSALDLMRDSAQQGSLAKSLVGIQGEIDFNQFQEKQQSYLTQAAAAQKAASGSIFGAILKGIGAVIPFLPK